MKTIDFRKLVFYFLPPGDRYLPDTSTLTTRVKWLQYLFAPLNRIMESFNDWRVETVIKNNVTGQTASLEWWLQKKFGAGIRIYHYDDLGVYLAREDEGGQFGWDVSTSQENTFVAVAKIGEVTRIQGVSFYVDVPNGINVDAVISELETYRIAGKQYQLNVL